MALRDWNGCFTLMKSKKYTNNRHFHQCGDHLEIYGSEKDIVWCPTECMHFVSHNSHDIFFRTIELKMTAISAKVHHFCNVFFCSSRGLSQPIQSPKHIIQSAGKCVGRIACMVGIWGTSWSGFATKKKKTFRGSCLFHLSGIIRLCPVGRGITTFISSQITRNPRGQACILVTYKAIAVVIILTTV